MLGGEEGSDKRIELAGEMLRTGEVHSRSNKAKKVRP
jgi:hypothetical protein